MNSTKFLRMFVAGTLFLPIHHHSGALAGEPAGSDRIAELRETIAVHDRLYFEEGRPEISDAAYDRLVSELAEREKAHGRTLHHKPMLSLEKGHNLKDVRRFYEGLSEAGGHASPEVCVEPKIDGMAISLIYLDGRFDRALTRGDGRQGKDITRNVRAIRGFPETIEVPAGTTAPEYLELRGELFISTPDFDQLNASRMAAGNSPFSTERNLAAGTALGDDVDAVRQRNLQLVCFDWGAWEPVDTAPVSQTAFLREAGSWGVPVIESMGPVAGADALLELMETGRRYAAETELPLDGLVLKVNRVDLRDRLGLGPISPNWAMAVKFPPEEIATELLNITYQISRSGRLSPVAVLEPVTVDGREISRASLHNWNFIREHDLRLGDQLVIELSGDVIPRITGLKAAVSPETQPVVFPNRCPECNGPVTYSDEMTTGTCDAGDCAGRLRERLLHFGNVLGIRGLGPETVRRLMESGAVKRPSDLYQLSADGKRVADLLGPGRGPHIIEAIEASRAAPFRAFIEALGMSGVGSVGAARIAEVFPSWQALMNWTVGEVPSGLTTLEPRLAQRLQEYLSDTDSRAELRQLMLALNSSARESSGHAPSPAGGRPEGPL